MNQITYPQVLTSTPISRASTTRKFKVNQLTTSEFYIPDVGGRGAGSVFEVKL